MSWNAGDWTGLASCITALGALLAGLRNHRSIGQAKDSVDQVHQLVNSHATAQEVRVDQLAASLTTAGVDVPPRAPPPPPEVPR